MPHSHRMNERAERYKQKAADCDQAAHGLSNPETKALYFDLAKEWRNLARQAEMLDRDERGDG